MKNKARNSCLVRDTRANREGYEQKRKDATKSAERRSVK
jgi:hypothetical protein